MALSKRNLVWEIAYTLLIAAAALFFCSKSSFGYPINDWTDANIYFTIGKGMARGQVVYRDLYDHKGPLLYALHALCALVSPSSFTGVYLLETLCLTVFLCLARRLLVLYGVKRAWVFALPLLALVICSSYSFQQGDSAEELCLPMLLYTLYSLLKAFKTGDGASSPRELALNGALFGCVFWMKFTLTGLYAGYMLTLFLYCAFGRLWKRAFAYVGWFLLGFALSTLPWVVYFGANGAIVPWLKTYLYDNLFLYSGAETTGLAAHAKAIVKSGLEWLWLNPGYTVPLAFGLCYCVLRKSALRWERVAVCLSAGLLALGTFIGGKSYPYYGLILAALAPLGFIAPCLLVEHTSLCKPEQRRLMNAAAALFCALCLALCPLISPNPRTSFGQARESTMQYQFAKLIDDPDASLLNYGFMDAGFYTAAGLVPRVKFFHQTNVPLQEMLDEQTRYIEEGLCDYVVTRGKQPESIQNHYTLIATADSPEGFWYEHVYLYRKTQP